MDEDEIARVRRSCTRFLTHHYWRTPHQVLRELAETTDPTLESDSYGGGELITRFERRVAQLLNKEAAVFMPSGTMCQQIALRVWSERCGTANVAFHPTCHLELHEEHAYQRLHGLSPVLLGSAERLFTLEDLQKIAEPLAALLIELPQREIGGQLPSWEELAAITNWARERGIPLHMDGARLWECRPFYKRDYATIAGLFDTVYVSFYKILDGIAGSILAGPSDIIARARVWQRRQGGNIVHLYPYVLAAQLGLEKHVARIESYYEKAQEVVATLAAFPQIEVVPDPPQTNMMHVYVRGDPKRLSAAAIEVARETRIWLTTRFSPTQLPSYCKFELTVGEATLDLSREEISRCFEMLFQKGAS